MPQLISPDSKMMSFQRDAVKVASQIRYGAATRLLFPVQLTNLSSRWRVSSLSYTPDAGVLRVTTYALGAGRPNLAAVSGAESRSGLPSFTIRAAATTSGPPVGPGGPRTSPCPIIVGKSTAESIHGTLAVVTRSRAGVHPQQQLCVPNAHGLYVAIEELGAHPAISVAEIFRHHMLLLGNGRANWTTKPIG